MKKTIKHISFFSFTMMFLLGIYTVSDAKTYTFIPNPSKDMYDFDHWWYYTWGINLTLQSGEVITDATLFIDNMNDWEIENDDILYVHLLDSAPLGEKKYRAIRLTALPPTCRIWGLCKITIGR